MVYQHYLHDHISFERLQDPQYVRISSLLSPEFFLQIFLYFFHQQEIYNDHLPPLNQWWWPWDLLEITHGLSSSMSWQLRGHTSVIEDHLYGRQTSNIWWESEWEERKEQTVKAKNYLILNDHAPSAYGLIYTHSLRVSAQIVAPSSSSHCGVLATVKVNWFVTYITSLMSLV